MAILFVAIVAAMVADENGVRVPWWAYAALVFVLGGALIDHAVS